MLTVHEEKCYVHQLRDRRIPARIQVNDSLLNSIEATMASLLASDPEMKMAALRAFVAYTFLDVSSNLYKRVSVRPSVRPSVSPSVHRSVRNPFF